MSARQKSAHRLPPFGKALQGRGPGLVLVVPNTCDGWRTANVHPPGDVLLLQLGHDPATYTWPVQGCDVVLYTESLDAVTADRTVDVLLRSGAVVVDCYGYRSRAAS